MASLLRLSLVLQGVGGLLLVAVCATLYFSRRRSYFLCWALAWLSFSLRLLLGALQMASPAEESWRPVLLHVGVLFGWIHPALWGLGMVRFTAGRRAAPWDGWLAVLLAGAGLAVAFVPHWWARNAALAGALCAVYGGSAVVLTVAYVRRGGFGLVFLAVWMAAYAIQQGHYVAIHLVMGLTGTAPAYLAYVGFADFVLQTFVVLGMVLVLVSAEERASREALARQAERLLQEERDFSARVIDTADVAIVVLDPSGRVVRANEKCRALTRSSEGELRGRLFGEALAEGPAGESALRRAVERVAVEAAAPGASVLAEAPLGSPEREQRRIAWHLSAVRDAEGAVRQIIAAGLDVTDRRRLEEQLRQRARQLAEADRHKDEFLAMLAHELRAPLAPIHNNLAILQLPRASPQEIEQARATIARQLELLVRLVDDLLDVYRLMQGKIELRPQALELRSLLEQALETARPAIEAQAHHLRVSVAEGAWLEGDLVRLVQVIANLLTNAAKYTDRGGQIELSGARTGAEVVVRVRDNGVGISPEVLPRVFELFVQSSQARGRSRGGLGIGLTVVRRLVELHGGSVEAHSGGPGQGSEFVVRLPCLAGPPADLPPVGNGLRAVPPPTPPAPRRALIVDDSVDAAESLALLLRRGGHTVRTAYSGPAALAAALELRPEVVVLDIGLPGMDGYEVARRLREQALPGERLLLIALTGYGQEGDCQRSLSAGLDHHLVKPIELRDLVSLLAELDERG